MLKVIQKDKVVEAGFDCHLQSETGPSDVTAPSPVLPPPLRGCEVQSLQALPVFLPCLLDVSIYLSYLPPTRTSRSDFCVRSPQVPWHWPPDCIQCQVQTHSLQYLPLVLLNIHVHLGLEEKSDWAIMRLLMVGSSEQQSAVVPELFFTQNQLLCEEPCRGLCGVGKPTLIGDE